MIDNNFQQAYEASDDASCLREFYLEYADAMVKKHAAEGGQVYAGYNVFDNIRRVADDGDEEADFLLNCMHASGISFCK